MPTTPTSPLPETIAEEQHPVLQPRPKAELTLKRGIISGFILFHLIAILIVSVPPTSLFIEGAKTAVRPYMLWSGLWQGWSMFSPEPPAFNNDLEGQITFRSGRTRVWKLPIPIDYGYYRRYFKERYRKWGLDNLRVDADSALWPDAARYIAYVNNDSSDPPDTIRLIRSWARIPPPDAKPADRSLSWSRAVFFTYPVRPADLR